MFSSSIILLAMVFIVSPVHAQQPLTPQQQCGNYQQELVLADISHQEARARAGNIMRQAYELEAKVKLLTEELEKEKAAHASTNDALAKLREASDAAKTAD